MQPRHLRLSERLRELPVLFADAIETLQAPGDDLAHVTATVSAEIDRAEKLWRQLVKPWPEPEVLMRDVVRSGPNALRESPKAGAAPGVLARHGWLAPLEPGTVVTGAPRPERKADASFAGAAQEV